MFFQVILCIPLRTILLLYRKDNSGGHNSNVYTDDRFFRVFSRSSLLNKKLGNKQNTSDNLLNIINYMYINPNESGEKFYIKYECSASPD